jgi:protoporphyrinogen oxidase
MRKAIIIGAGPAGLTAAYELLTRTDIKPVILESDSQVGGLSRTVNYQGNRIDIGGHRFFSKSQRVVDWWLRFMPVESDNASVADRHMLIRPRKSRIYYHRHFYDYPLQLNRQMIRNMGLVKMCRIGISYLKARMFPLPEENNLEQFFINRFGRELYQTFFAGYTEKVWGVPCRMIPSSWGRQRIKDLDISKLLKHWLRSFVRSDKSLRQQRTSTSLIEQFLYPPLGPGQMWEIVAAEIQRLGGEIFLQTEVVALHGVKRGDRLQSITVQDRITGERRDLEGEYFFSTMPVQELIAGLMGMEVPDKVQAIAAGLQYRDFLIVGILATGLMLEEGQKEPIRDNWIYVQDEHIKAGRLQFFHNWSPHLVSDGDHKWLGVEYFCNETDAFWGLEDDRIREIAIAEMESIGVLSRESVRDSIVLRVKKAYPSYFGTYEHFDVIKDFLGGIGNLYPLGRNGMHRYNNSDHSMLTAMAAVDGIIAGKVDKSGIWDINTEQSYHEEKGNP